ncbi:MAG: RDD family protein [Paraperlucidibaca sp.]
MSRTSAPFQRKHRQKKPTTPASITPSALEYPRAGISVRLICLLYDGLLLIALLAVLNVILVGIFTSGQSAHAQEIELLSPQVRYGLQFPASVLIIFGFYGYCWTRSGQTLGMQTWHLELIRRDGHRPRWRDALRRFLSACVLPVVCGALAWVLQDGNGKAFGFSVLLGFVVNYVWGWLPLTGLSHGRCLHDVMSDTEVVRVPVRPKTRKPYRFLGLFGDK